MEQRKDFIEREIQRLTLLLTNLISKISGTNPSDLEVEMKETDDMLKREFNLTINAIISMKDSTLNEKMKNIHINHLEKIVELISKLIKTIESTELEIDKKELTKKGLLMIAYIDLNSQTFSLSRLHLKNCLMQYL